ncbi:exosortase B [Duganella sp. 1224]|uniref:exosortase B n=1 Tax=Duganella sp. 1224 TaxID=2587052 RepID=UPI0015CB1EA5|nr:exosortase B [Duganella sp. 1224]NYE62162.1 exosortase B [Duganella sp. 1224]
MAHTLERGALSGRQAALPWLIVAAGLLAMYVPSFIDLFQGPWGSDKNAHGPIVMAVAFAYLGVRLRQLVEQRLWQHAPAPLAGGLLLLLGLACYALGRSQNVLLLEVGSLIVVLTALVVGFFGLRTWRRMWFAFFFMLFMIPLPASVVDAVTLPLKIGVSYASEQLLYWLGYPISRSGVILNIGQYQLLVADACAGLNSLFTLEALGLLYMNLVRHPSLVRNVVLAALIVPISFTANTIRIVTLALITYHLGDAAGQGFLHGFSGMVLFLSALGLIIAVDSGLSWLVTRGRPPAPPPPPVARAGWAQIWPALGTLALRPAVLVALAMGAGVAAAHALTPVYRATAAVDLAASVPRQFGEWREVSTAMAQAQLATDDDGAALVNQIYDEVLMRTYVNPRGEHVMLALAYAREQRQDVKIHLPDVCYPAQGYKVLSGTPAQLTVAPGAPVPGRRLLAAGNGRMEAISYWVRIGDAYPQGGLAMRMKIFKDGLRGQIDDGLLVRVSMLVDQPEQAAASYARQQQFLQALVAAVPPGRQVLLAAAP